MVLLWRWDMRILTSLAFLIGLAGSAWASVGAPAPEMSAGILGMTMAAGVVYLIKRRRRSYPVAAKYDKQKGGFSAAFSFFCSLLFRRPPAPSASCASRA